MNDPLFALWLGTVIGCALFAGLCWWALTRLVAWWQARERRDDEGHDG